MNFSLLLTGLAAYMVGSFAIAGPSFDVGGIRVGSTMSEARAAAKALNPQLVLRDLKQSDGRIVGFEGREKISVGQEPAGARSLTPGATVEKFLAKDHVVALFDAKGITWFIGRTQGYVPGAARPTYTAAWEALREKFGEPSLKSGSQSFSSGSWEFDRSGILFSRKGNLVSAPGPCGINSNGSQFAADPAGGLPITAPGTFSSKCSVRVDASINASKTSLKGNDEGLVQYLSLTVYDSARMYDSLKINQDSENAAANKAKEAEFELAKGVKPKL